LGDRQRLARVFRKVGTHRACRWHEPSRCDVGQGETKADVLEKTVAIVCRILRQELRPVQAPVIQTAGPQAA
jgi:hypothetical protein